MKTEIEIVPYGEVFSALSRQRWRSLGHHTRISKSLERTPRSQRRVFVTFSYDLDDSFAELFRKKATQDTRLLILNEGASTDRLLSRIVDLQIRTPQRFCVIDAAFGAGKSQSLAVVRSLLRRIAASAATDNSNERILNSKVDDGGLHVVSTNFNRLEVPLTDVPEFEEGSPAELRKFEIDEDGALIYWPDLDVHLGWQQLQQMANPEAALKVSQRSEEFNERYGKAVQTVREQAGLKPREIFGISEKQLGRIEK